MFVRVKFSILIYIFWFVVWLSMGGNIKFLVLKNSENNMRFEIIICFFNVIFFLKLDIYNNLKNLKNKNVFILFLNDNIMILLFYKKDCNNNVLLLLDNDN